MTVRLELNSVAIQELLKSPEMQAQLKERADKIAGAAGNGVEVEQTIGRTRARASVRAATYEARAAESEDKVLTRAFDAGRG